MPYPTNRQRRRTELRARWVDTAVPSRDDPDALEVRYSQIEGLEAVRRHMIWVRVSRWKLAVWLRLLPWPEELADAVEQVTAYLERGREKF